MKALKIRVYPDAILRTKCLPLERVAAVEKELFEQMLFTMKCSRGIGLAAPQIGIARRMIVVDIGKGPVRLANPVLLQAQGSGIEMEGCLSVPGANVFVERADEAVVSGMNEKGKPVVVRARGLLARALQHEMDHLEGKLILDYLVSSREQK